MYNEINCDVEPVLGVMWNWMMLLTLWRIDQGLREGDEDMVKYYRHSD